MQITGFTKTYMIYQIKCNNTNKIYIGSTSNLTARINTHVSSFKTGVSHCSSVEVLKGNNYSITVLRDNILCSGTGFLSTSLISDGGLKSSLSLIYSSSSRDSPGRTT